MPPPKKGPPKEAPRARGGTVQVQAQLDDIQTQLAVLATSMNAVLGLEGIRRVLENGLEAMAEELQPLRDLGPPRTTGDLDDATGQALANLRAALQSPNWSEIGSLRFLDTEAGFVGQPLPPPANQPPRMGGVP